LHKDKEAEKIGFPIDLIKLGKNFSEEIEIEETFIDYKTSEG